MPWLSTPCRSAQDRMSAVGSALSSGMPQADRMALICARCVSYDAGMTVSSHDLRAALRGRGVPARVSATDSSDGEGSCAWPPLEASSQALARPLRGSCSGSICRARRAGTPGECRARLARSARRPALPRRRRAGLAARCTAGRGAVGTGEIRPAAILGRGDARPPHGSSRSPTGSAPWTGSPRRRCSWCGAATCGAVSACARCTACRTPTTTSTRSSTPRSIARWRWDSSWPPRTRSGWAPARSATCAATSSACRRCSHLPPGVYPVAGLSVGWPVFRRPVSMRLPPSVVVHRERYDDSAMEPKSRAYDERRRAREPVARRQPEEQRRLSAARRRGLERERRAPALGAGTLRLCRLSQNAGFRPCLRTTFTTRPDRPIERRRVRGPCGRGTPPA